MGDNAIFHLHAKSAGGVLYSSVPECGNFGFLPYREAKSMCLRVRQIEDTLEVIEYGSTLDTTSRFPGNILKVNISVCLL